MDDSTFSGNVRSDTLNRVLKNIEEGESMKLLGIPGLGMSYLLKTINKLCSPKGLCKDIGVSFYFSNDYDFLSFQFSLNMQLKSMGFGKLKTDADNFLMIAGALSESLLKDDPDKKIIFLFDNFHKNFAPDENVRDTTETILTKFNLDKIRTISDDSNYKVVFIVTYTYPLEHFLGTNWYLNDLLSEEIKLLTEEEQGQFIKNRISPDNFPNGRPDIELIKYYGGRYPMILCKALKTDFSVPADIQKMEDWILRRYLEIVKDFEAFGPRSDKEGSHLNTLKKIVNAEGEFHGTLRELPAQYCYRSVGNDQAAVNVFSDHFRDHLTGKREPIRRNTITWLHLSDLHLYEDRDGWDTDDILKSLVDELDEMYQINKLKPDMIFFTGDMAFGHVNDQAGSLETQYKGVNEFLEKVRKVYPEPVPKENIFLVPGNHDVNRKKISNAIKILLRSEMTEEEITYMIKSADQDWKDSFRRLEDYRKFLDVYGYGHLMEDPERLVYGIKRTINGFRVGIGGFNTCWSCTGDHEKGKLWMGAQWQFKTIKSKIRDTDLSIALLHHPPNWFVEKEDRSFDIKLQETFDFCLHGHEHTKWVEQLSESDHTKISAGACYASSAKETGFNIVRLNPDTCEGEVWLRVYSDEGVGGWIPKYIRKKTTPLGVWKLKKLNFNINTGFSGVKESAVPPDAPPFIEALLKSDESDVLEFKSSVRWDYKGKKINKKLEQVILKTIAAFSNFKGGNLVIGMDDNNKILGLEKDFQALNGDRDKFERHLRQIISNAFGKVFATNNTKIKFYRQMGEDICLLSVEKGDKPLPLVTQNSHGQRMKKFYLRSGNRSIELDLGDTLEYCFKRFNITGQTTFF